MLKTVHQLKTIRNFIRYVSTAPKQESEDRMTAWQVHSFEDDMQLCSTRVPIIYDPATLLVKIDAASVNPIDVMMKKGYARNVLQLFRCQDIVFPITLGRDFCGTVIDKGYNVSKYEIGDKVYGVIPFHKDGSHAETALVHEDHICQKPDNISDIDAASVPYVALTAYSALWYTAGYKWGSIKNTKILILGASGGVGAVAVQMLKAEGACVIGTCSTDAVPLVQGFGADCVLDYRDPNYFNNVASQGKFDVILDCAQFGHKNLPPAWNYSTYITLNSPLMINTDKYGLLGGLAASAADLIPSNVCSITNGKCVKWAFFVPTNEGMLYTNKLISECKIIPVVQNVFNFNELPKAYEKVQEGHLRGKVVINMNN